MKYFITGIAIALFSSLVSSCNTSKSTSSDTALIDQITDVIESEYDPVPQRYYDSPEFRKIRETYHTGDSTNSVVNKVLGYDVEIVEHRFNDSLVYAVSIRCTIPEDPIPEISPDDVEKIIYGYSIDEGLVIEDKRDIKSIISCIKNQSVKEFEDTIFLAVDNLDPSFVISTTHVHGCTLAIRMILKDGEKTGTHGHIDERDWNPVVADLFIKAMDEGRVAYLGGFSLSNMYPEEQTHEEQTHGALTYQIKGGEIGIIACDTNVTPTVIIPSIIKNRPVTHIEHYTFTECSKLTDIVIPNSVTNINVRALDCINLATITVATNNPVYSSFDGALLNRNGTDLLFVPSGNSGSYSIPNNVSILRDQAFSYDSSITNITITGNVTNIGEHTFLDYPKLMSISVIKENSVYSSVDGVLFNKHQSIIIRYPSAKTGSYTIPDRVTHIGKWAFYDCTGLTSITVPDHVTHIEDWAFDSCPNLSGINFLGNAPSLPIDDRYIFPDNVIIYYEPGTKGWHDTYGGRPTVLRNP